MLKTFALRQYARYRMQQLERIDPVTVQQDQLLSLVNRAKDTDFGREHEFSQIRSIGDFQERVPLRDHTAFWNEWWKGDFPLLVNRTWPGKIPMYTISSGTTTGITKYFPFNWEMIRSTRKAGIDMLVYHLVNRPHSKAFDGLSFFLGGSAVVDQEAPGVFSGDVSDIMMMNLPWWAKRNHYPRGDLAGIKSWEERVDRVSRDSIKRNVRVLSGVPSWLLILLNKLREITGGTIKDFYPQLEMIIHGGVNFEPYRELFEEFLEGSKAELREVYPASECYFASEDRGSGEGMRMTLDHGVFFEFVPLEELESDKPTRHWVKNLETGVNYAMVLSSPSGLWSYVIGDTVRFIERDPARLFVTGRTSYMLSAFGEHLIGEEIREGLQYATHQVGGRLVDYSVGALYPENSSALGGHLYVLEFAAGSVSKRV